MCNGPQMTMVRLASKHRFILILDRTNLRISLSGTKFDAEADFDVFLAVAPQKPHQVDKKMISDTKKHFFSEA